MINTENFVMQDFKWQGMFVLITYIDRCFPSYYPTFSVVHSIICFYVVIFKTLFIQQIIITSTSLLKKKFLIT